MRLLLDEMMPRKLVSLFASEAATVQQQGWRGKKNGESLDLAQREFDASLTMDRSIEHQQNMEDLARSCWRARGATLSRTSRRS